MSSFYHYSSLERWGDIVRGPRMPDSIPGLEPRRSVCPNNFGDVGARSRAVFGLTEAKPTEWVDSMGYPVAWQRLMASTGDLLLRYHLNDELVEKSYIIDWSHMEKHFGYHRDDYDNPEQAKATHQEQVKAERFYWNSKVPLESVIENPALLGQISLPEVITMTTVPLEAIEIAEVQPKLTNLDEFSQRELARAIGFNPSLAVLDCYLS